jgi:hypothetical protein
MVWHDADGYEVDDADEKRAIITDLVNGIPAVDAAPVVHGRWEFCGDDDLVCSVCGARYYKKWLLQSYYTGPGSDRMDGFLYCPHCGALLDGGDSDA